MTDATLATGASLHGFTVIDQADLPEIEGRAYLLTHDTSKARLLYLKNDDNNKSFSISFKTPPQDDTGVFHILEHSVLCGSDSFPVKEPFVNLLKTSMQTFLNALTFPDKTMYPVASTNEQDLFNLMDVYLDAVLHPAIYSKKNIFEQEGWHIERLVATPDGILENDEEGFTAMPAERDGATTIPQPHSHELQYNGVVYNEMKGALSDPPSVLLDLLCAELFPNTAYRFESGGTPDAIPTLTYEQFLNEHRRHYRLDNSYLFLYGNLDINRALSFLDEKYLSPLGPGSGPVARTLEEQSPVISHGAIKKMDTTTGNECCAAGFVIGRATEKDRVFAADVLVDAIAGSNESPLKKALFEAEIADDVSACVCDSLLQPFVSITLKGAKPDARERMLQIIEKTCRELVTNGVGRDILDASIRHSEFILREHDFSMSDGVIYAMSAMESWLYDDAMPWSYLQYEDTLEMLKSNLETDYYEQLTRELFLENNHIASVEVRSTEHDEKATSDSALKHLVEQMDDEDFARIDEQVAILRKAQEESDTPEALATLPQLTRKDIGKAPEEPGFSYRTDTPIPCIDHQVKTRGIMYTKGFYSLDKLSFEDLPYVSLLAFVLGKFDTDLHSASDIDTLLQTYFGNFTFTVSLFGNVNDPDDFSVFMEVSTSALESNVKNLVEITEEVMYRTRFESGAKLKTMLSQIKKSLESKFTNSGNATASERISSYYSQEGVVREALNGVDYYHFICDLLEHFDQQSDDILNHLATLARSIFDDRALTISLTGSEASKESFWQHRLAHHSDADANSKLIVPAPVKRNEAFIIPSDIAYVATGYNFRKMNQTFNAAWNIGARALSFDYLWNEVRVKGGAYGVSYATNRMGKMRFTSYRDPRIDETLRRFEESCDWIGAFNPTEQEMDGYLVSSIAGLDTPKKPRLMIAYQDSLFFSKSKKDTLTITRNEMLEATKESVRTMAESMKKALSYDYRCVFGNKDIIDHASTDFHAIDLFRN